MQSDREIKKSSKSVRVNVIKCPSLRKATKMHRDEIWALAYLIGLHKWGSDPSAAYAAQRAVESYDQFLETDNGDEDETGD